MGKETLAEPCNCDTEVWERGCAYTIVDFATLKHRRCQKFGLSKSKFGILEIFAEEKIVRTERSVGSYGRMVWF